MIPLPAINSTSAYTFTGGFSTLNGIYTVTEISSFGEALAAGVNFIESLYNPAGVLATQYSTDAPGYVDDTVLYLTPADGVGPSIYVPNSLLATLPDPMVGCYNNLAIGVSLGVFDDQTKLAWIINELNQLLSGVAGVTNPVKLYSLGTKWMSVADYEALQAERAAAQTAYTTLYQQLQQQIALTETAQNLNSYYQNSLIALAAA